MAQLHRRLTTDQVTVILDQQINREITGQQAADYLGISRRRLYRLRQEYEARGSAFTIAYERTTPTRTISAAAERHILRELEIEKTKIVDDPAVPTDTYNYSYVQQQLVTKYHETVSVPTIIKRAKHHGYWKNKPPKKVHDREVVTNYTGELVQHDTSHHLFAPDSGQPWCLTTSLDDYSRAMLYADFWETETTWNHIVAAQSVAFRHGVALRYYVDQLRVFRYVKNRDKFTPWREFQKFTDDVDPQWKQVMKDVGTEVIYALSPQAKGKIERPYRWLQDHIVRTCVREGVTTLAEGRAILKQEVNDYNWKRIHSTTGEIPMRRFEAAREEQKSLWRPFTIAPPFTSTKDIFCLRTRRIVDPYRQVSINKLKLTVPGVPPRQAVELRLSPDLTHGVTDVRFWFQGHCVGQQVVKNQALPIVQV